MTTTSTTPFPTRITLARRELRTAQLHTKPLDPELAALLRERRPAEYAECEAKVAAILATIPALQATVDALEAQACGRCNGSGDYSGPTNATRRGRPYCFACNGTGQLRSAR